MTEIAASCGSCGADLGTTADMVAQKDLMRQHFETCLDYLDGEGLKKERPIGWQLMDDAT